MKGYAWVLLFAAASMDCFAGFDEGIRAYAAQDYQAALKEFLPLANAGDVATQSILGLMYYSGDGVSKDFGEAAEWYRKAAEKGGTTSQRLLGKMYFKGEGVPQNYTQAAEWYRKAAEQGDAEALNSLGVVYAKGEGVAKNLVLAHVFYNLAATNGNENAKMNRDKANSLLTPLQINEAQDLASKWVINQSLPSITKTYPSSP